MLSSEFRIFSSAIHDGLCQSNATFIHGTVIPTSQKMCSSHIVFDNVTLSNILGIACYDYRHRMPQRKPTVSYPATCSNYCLPSLLSSLVVYLHYSKITYLLVKTVVIFLPIRFYFPLHSGLYLSILSSNLPPES
jgi:hypothetical protein